MQLLFSDFVLDFVNIKSMLIHILESLAHARGLFNDVFTRRAFICKAIQFVITNSLIISTVSNVKIRYRVYIIYYTLIGIPVIMGSV